LTEKEGYGKRKLFPVNRRLAEKIINKSVKSTWIVVWQIVVP
jgi:hypothetical protein